MYTLTFLPIFLCDVNHILSAYLAWWAAGGQRFKICWSSHTQIYLKFEAYFEVLLETTGLLRGATTHVANRMLTKVIAISTGLVQNTTRLHGISSEASRPCFLLGSFSVGGKSFKIAVGMRATSCKTADCWWCHMVVGCGNLALSGVQRNSQ